MQTDRGLTALTFVSEDGKNYDYSQGKSTRRKKEDNFNVGNGIPREHLVMWDLNEGKDNQPAIGELQPPLAEHLYGSLSNPSCGLAVGSEALHIRAESSAIALDTNTGTSPTSLNFKPVEERNPTYQEDSFIYADRVANRHVPELQNSYQNDPPTAQSYATLWPQIGESMDLLSNSVSNLPLHIAKTNPAIESCDMYYQGGLMEGYHQNSYLYPDLGQSSCDLTTIPSYATNQPPFGDLSFSFGISLSNVLPIGRPGSLEPSRYV